MKVSIIHSQVSNCGSLFTSDAYFQFNSMLIVARAVFTDMDMRARAPRAVWVTSLSSFIIFQQHCEHHCQHHCHQYGRHYVLHNQLKSELPCKSHQAKDPATKSVDFMEKFQRAFEKLCCKFFIMDMVAFMQGCIGQIVSVNIF